MKIEPTYLVAPEPDPSPRGPTRRAFLLGIAVGVAGGAVFGALALRRATTRSVGEPPIDGRADDGPAPIDDRLRWALELQDGPLEPLVHANTDFLMVFTDQPAARARLEPGLDRLVYAVLEDDPAVASQRALLAAKLAQSIEVLPAASPLHAHLASLRRIAR